MEAFRLDSTHQPQLFDAGFFLGDFAHESGFTSAALLNLGFTDDQMRNGEYQRRIHPADRPTYDSVWERFASGKSNELYCEYRISDPDGIWHWIQTTAVVLDRQPDGRIGRVIGTDRDITARKFAEEMLRDEFRETRRKYELCESLRQAARLVSTDLSLSRSPEFVVEQLKQVVEFHCCELYSLESIGPRQLLRTAEPGCADPDDVYRLAESLGQSVYPIIEDVMNESTNYGSRMTVPVRYRTELVGVAVLWHESSRAYQGADLYPVMDVAEILAVAIRNNQAIRRALDDADQDLLTGFLTRRAFDRDAPLIWRRSCSEHRSNAIAMLDIDHFKQVNDTNGHQVGDEVIRHVAAAVRSAVRTTDLVGNFGGDEFVVVLPDADESRAALIMDRVRSTVEALETGPEKLGVTVSVGVVVGSGEDELQELLPSADAALYEAKRLGRNRVILNGHR